MQSRIATALIQRQISWVFSSTVNSRVAGDVRHRCLATFPTGRAADPAVHSGDPEGEDADQAAMAAGAPKPPPTKGPKEEMDPLVPPKPPQSTPKLENPAVNNPATPDSNQKVQKRGLCSAGPPVDQVGCDVGVDGSGGPEENKGGRRGQEEDDKEYFSHHKPSPLSEIEMADTRKPITRATDGTADSGAVGYFGGGNVVGWLPEQLDTVEQALARATEIWWRNKITGDPDSPQSRVLRALRGES